MSPRSIRRMAVSYVYHMYMCIYTDLYGLEYGASKFKLVVLLFFGCWITSRCETPFFDIFL